jgi:hypothetical protein
MYLKLLVAISALIVAATPLALRAQAAGDSVAVNVKWDAVVRVSETVPTTQHLANAFTLRSSPLNKKLLQDLRDLHTNDTRLQLWFSVPNQVIAELKEPTATETFWDFTYMDPVVVDFFANTQGIRHINIGTIPRWMFNVPPVEVPSDPAASFYPYTNGTTGDLLKDPTGKQFADFQARIFSWYTQGGFTDEIGKYHKSGYHFKIDYWGVLNEPSIENHISVEEYTVIFDAVAEAIHKIDPNAQFMGPEIVGAPYVLPFARYFLNPKNHNPSAPPVQWFSFHNYVMANNDPAAWQGKFFTSPPGEKDFGVPALPFADQLREVIKVRNELSPNTKIALDELGTFDGLKPFDFSDPNSSNPANTTEPYSAYSPLYWVASGGNWAVNFIIAENQGVPLISMTQMVGAPTQSESCSMINWDTSQPNAHYRVLQLINGNFGPGDKLVDTQSSSHDVVAQASITPSGQKILLVNTSNQTVLVDIANALHGSSLHLELVDEASGEQPPRAEHISGQSVTLAPFAVAVVSAGGK